MAGETSERPDPQLDGKGKQVAAFGINPNLAALRLPPQINPNRNLIIRGSVMPLNPFQALPPPPRLENFIPFGVPILERPSGYAALEDEAYSSPPVFNINPHVTIAYNPVMRYTSNTLVNPLGMYPTKRYVQLSSFMQTGYEDACFVIDGAKGISTGGEKKHDQEVLELNLHIASAGSTYKKEITAPDEDLDLELHL